MILALRERGSNIANLQWDKLHEQNIKINQLLTTQFDQLTVPVSAFITFVEEDIRTLALENSSNKTLVTANQKL